MRVCMYICMDGSLMDAMKTKQFGPDETWMNLRPDDLQMYAYKCMCICTNVTNIQFGPDETWMNLRPDDLKMYAHILKNTLKTERH
jgi:hypothetical protein